MTQFLSCVSKNLSILKESLDALRALGVDVEEDVSVYECVSEFDPRLQSLEFGMLLFLYVKAFELYSGDIRNFVRLESALRKARKAKETCHAAYVDLITARATDLARKCKSQEERLSDRKAILTYRRELVKNDLLTFTCSPSHYTR